MGYLIYIFSNGYKYNKLITYALIETVRILYNIFKKDIFIYQVNLVYFLILLYIFYGNFYLEFFFLSLIFDTFKNSN